MLSKIIKIKFYFYRLAKFVPIVFLCSLPLVSCSDDISNSKSNPLESTITQCPVNGQWCHSIVNQQKIAILLPTEISYLKPFQLNLRVLVKNNVELEKVQLRFSMLGMQMGGNQFNLKFIKFEDIQQLWQTEVVLPMCLSGRHDWLLEIKVNEIHHSYSITI